MKKLFNILIILSILATPQLVVQAYARRGYFAVGGEWLAWMIPLLLLILFGQVKQLYTDVFGQEKAPTDASQ